MDTTTMDAVRSVLDGQRAIAFDAIDDLMVETFEMIGKIIAESGASSGVAQRFNGSLGGFSATQLNAICDCYRDDDIAGWVASGAGGTRNRLAMAFLNYGKMQMDDFRRRFPNAYRKWDEVQDAELLRLYQEAVAGGAGGSASIPWNELEHTLGRNEKALKIRLARLGVPLDGPVPVARY